MTTLAALVLSIAVLDAPPAALTSPLGPMGPTGLAQHAAAADLAKARDLLTRKKFEEARDAFQAIVESAPDDPAVRIGLGSSLVGCGDFAGAVSALSKATDLAPGDYAANFELGAALRAQGADCVANGDYEGAGYAFTDSRRFFEEAAKADPKRAEALLEASRVAAQNGDSEGALELAEQALAREPKNVDVLLDVGARRFFATAAKVAENDVEGARAMRERSREAYQTIIGIDAANGKAWNGLGWIAKQVEDPVKAIEAFGKSVELDPGIDDSYRQLSALLSDSKEKRQQLLAVLDKAVTHSKTFGAGEERKLAQGLAHFYRGKAKAQLRDTKGLESDMKEAVAAWPDLKAAAALQIALTLTTAGQYPEAATRLIGLSDADLAVYVAAVLADSDPRQTLLSLRGLADQLVKGQNPSAARDVFRLVAHAQSNSADDWNNYAFFCRETGRYEESYVAYTRAVELRPNDAGILNDTALILQYHLNRDLEYAVELYDRAVVEGNKVLADPGIDDRTRQDAQTAVRDATNNGRMLRAALEKGGAKPPDPANGGG